MKAPQMFHLKDLQFRAPDPTESQVSVLLPEEPGGESVWMPARCMGMDSIPNRFKLAWMVFTGKGDVVIWPGGQ